MQRLDRLVMRLLAKRIRSPRGFWRFELDLLKLQRDIQAGVTRAKASGTRQGRHEAKQLQETLWHAKRLGDSLAWMLFGPDRRSVDFLSDNEPVPVPPEGDGPRGMVAAAQAMYPEYGLPLLHDITDLLRIGDVTFFRPDKRPLTVEMKTALLDSKTNGRVRKINYRVTAIWPASDQPPKEVLVPEKLRARQPALASKRFERQLKRMSTAHALVSAEVGKATIIDGGPALIVKAQGTSEPSHWSLIRHLVRVAKRTGYASGVADGTTLYILLYDPEGLSVKKLPTDRTTYDMANSGILLPDTSRNVINIYSLPDSRGRAPHRYTPYYLYPLPRTAVLDMLNGRLGIMSVVNLGRVANALEEAGFKVGDLDGPNLKVFCDVATSRGKYRVGLPVMNMAIRETIMEAMPLSHLVAIGKATLDGITEEFPAVLRDLEATRKQRPTG
jgi:hypothetical protein